MLPLFLQRHGLVLLLDERLVRRVLALAAHVHALAVVGIRVDVVRRLAIDALASDELVGGHRLDVLGLLWRVRGHLAEPGLGEQVLGVAHLESAGPDSQGEADQCPCRSPPHAADVTPSHREERDAAAFARSSSTVDRGTEGDPRVAARTFGPWKSEPPVATRSWSWQSCTYVARWAAECSV